MSQPEPPPEPSPEPQPQANAPQEPGTQPWAMTPADASSAPPPPVLVGPDKTPYTPGEWALFFLGAIVALVSVTTFLLGSLALLLVFLLAKPPRAPFVRGLGLGLAILGVLLLGALTLCFLSLAGAPFGLS